MSLTTNNTSLQEILAKVNALPEAGSGSGGGVETCVVTPIYLSKASAKICFMAYSTSTEKIEAKAQTFTNEEAEYGEAMFNAVAGTLVTFIASGTLSNVTLDNGELVQLQGNTAVCLIGSGNTTVSLT